ncbi:leucyl aminopeptidase [Lysobacter enzymogenes]|uniref:Probable cytosol aminopeptidase n=1 Tax=Lysobacter enzymogenes TaxID=69 RepID=A0A0S2DLY5_LYSEN|nr:leucyl aminopeptidase [Lysobacter enzymogenes]ALN59536.1 cytosol aminopeptidase family [Lysobacter enzymogenes]QCW27672.1 leucyl aminopeptidase [Lysobacter enzymogenes]QQQ02389.1 leucyl aminopeptidase [Lysobacter enzymogenes]
MTLEFDLNRDAAAAAQTDCVVVGAFADKTLTAAARTLDEASGGRLTVLLERGDISGKTGKTALLHDVPGVASPRVLVVGLGEPGKFGVAQYLKAVGDAARALKAGPVAHALLTLSEEPVAGRDAAWAIRQAAIAADHACYRYTATLGKKKDEPGLRKLSIAGGDAAALAHGQAIAAGVQFARELGNLPPNVCNPAYLAQQASEFAGRFANTECEVLDRAQMQELGMGSLLAVARGSANPPKLIVLKYSNGGDAKPYVLVGKGITFDTGGINLKVQGGIEEMKFDMCGAASVMGAFVAAVGMQLPINLVVIVPAVENMPDADAYRPSDVLTSMSGKTIEVGNTDAEGRLILCDALTYAQRFEPQALLDVATLTGACVVALGKFATGLMSKHDDLSAELIGAGEQVFDRAWRLPLWDEYQTQLESSFADVYNIGGRWAGAITAGCFLARFAEGQRWAHLDIAGVASEEGKRGLSTGRPVGMLSQWLLERGGA